LIRICKYTEKVKHLILQYCIVVWFKMNAAVRCRLSDWSGKWAAAECLTAECLKKCVYIEPEDGFS
jgi:hypothetical protein